MGITDNERLLEVFVQEINSSISSLREKVTEEYEWVDSIEEAESLGRRLRGIFIASLVGEIEEEIGGNFSSLFATLTDTPTVEHSKYWSEHMPKTSSLCGRAKVMWAIRIAYTHGNGSLSQIGDPKVAVFLDSEFTDKHFEGLVIKNNIVSGLEQVLNASIKTVLEIKDSIKE